MLPALPSLPPRPWRQTEAHRPLQRLAGSQPTLDVSRAHVSGIQVLVGHARAPPPCTGQGRGIFAGRGPTGLTLASAPLSPITRVTQFP